MNLVSSEEKEKDTGKRKKKFAVAQENAMENVVAHEMM